MNLNPEYIEYLNKELKHLDNELISILELPDVQRLRDRIKKDKRDTQAMLDLYARIENCNILIGLVKDEISGCIAEMRRHLGLKNNNQRSNGYYPSEDLSEE